MKKQSLAGASSRLIAFSTFLVLLLFAGCTKRGIAPLPGNTIDYCRISYITFQYEPGYTDTLTFIYNAAGTPIRIDRTNVGTGSPRYIFRYDNEGRLLDFVGAYAGNGGAEFWTRYFYSSDNRTVYDTTYSLVTQDVSWPPIFTEPAITHTRKYDRLGRLDTLISPYFTPIVINGDTVATAQIQPYVYDRQGNLEGGGQYDDKINYHRTNWVWQFIDNQYSTNNPFPIQQYNAYGLPTEMNYNLPPNTILTDPILFELTFPQTVIHYSCDVPAPPNGSGRNTPSQ